jgi:quercetin dioxygenase-like cupin family protein
MTTATATACARTAPAASSVLPQVGYTTRFFADQITVKHAGETLDVWQATVLSGCEPPGHVHGRHDEWLQVLEGSVRAIVGEDEYELAAGDLLHLPKGVPHRYEVIGREATIQVVTSPGGFVEVFAELNRRFGRGGMPCVLAPNHLEVLEPALAEYGIELANV